MITYAHSNVAKLFLSPYIEMNFSEQGVICHNKINDMTVGVKLSSDVFEKLAEGITYQELTTYLLQIGMEKNDVEMLIKKLMQKGVIE